MTARLFVDTNVLVYSRDSSAGEKHRKANDWLDALAREATPCVSWQVLVELYNVVTRKLPRPLEPSAARTLVLLLDDWNPLPPSVQLLRTAWEIEDESGLAWWDAQIVAAAHLQQCAYLLSEDLQDGQQIRGVRIVNPFTTETRAVLKGR